MDNSLQKTWMFRADLGEVDRISAEVSSCLQELELQKHNFAVQLLLREALNNAVLHGSAQDPAKQVRLDLHISADALCLAVEDEGPGFDWRSILANPLAGQTQECGRGLQIYRFYADRVEFNSSGSRVVLTRLLNPLARAA